jgi:hypothetical protein
MKPDLSTAFLAGQSGTVFVDFNQNLATTRP